jgi:hypothetical protein
MKPTVSLGAAGSPGAGVGSSEGAGVSDGAGAVGSVVGAVLGSGVAGSVASGEGGALSLGVALADASGEEDGSGSVANVASGDMMLDMKTTSVKKTRTLRVALWRADRTGVGTNRFPSMSTFQPAGRGRRSANGRLAFTVRHPEQYGRIHVTATTGTDLGLRSRIGTFPDAYRGRPI